MKKKIVPQKRNVKKKKHLKLKPVSAAKWGMAFEKLAHKRPLTFNFIKRDPCEFNLKPTVNGDPFCGQGVPDVECDHKDPITCVHTQFPDFSDRERYKISKSAATRGELGAAPAHYSKGKFTPWEVIDDWKLDYYCGNAVKYVCRHKHKGKPVEDIQKAIDCLIKYKQDLMEFYATQEKINTIANFMDMDKETK